MSPYVGRIFGISKGEGVPIILFDKNEGWLTDCVIGGKHSSEFDESESLVETKIEGKMLTEVWWDIFKKMGGNEKTAGSGTLEATKEGFNNPVKRFLAQVWKNLRVLIWKFLSNEKKYSSGSEDSPDANVLVFHKYDKYNFQAV